MSGIDRSIDPCLAGYRQLLAAAPHLGQDGASGVHLGFEQFTQLAENFFTELPQPQQNLFHWATLGNRQVDAVDPRLLAEHWLPYSFVAHRGETCWCLPTGRAEQPFHDEYISTCRQAPINTLLAPRTSLQAMLSLAVDLPNPSPPAGFVFHLSRCGSTLVSGCFAALAECSVLSESSALTEILLAQHLETEVRSVLIRLLVQLQGRVSPAQSHLIIKWNAWDVYQWQLLRAVFPDVPVLLLIRNPVEILASHQCSAGRHMSGDPTLRHLHPAFAAAQTAESLLQFRVCVLKALMTQMLAIATEPGVAVVDYADLNLTKLIHIANWFGIDCGAHQQARMAHRAGRHSKTPTAEFQADSDWKRTAFSNLDRQQIEPILSDTYRRLRDCRA